MRPEVHGGGGGGEPGEVLLPGHPLAVQAAPGGQVLGGRPPEKESRKGLGGEEVRRGIGEEVR